MRILASAGAVAVAAIPLQQHRVGMAGGPAGGNAVHACALYKQSFLTAKDLGPFTHFLTRTYRQSPFGGHMLPGTRSPLVSDFQAARLEGFLNNMALRGRYRGENNREARALHYKIGKWPLVPLFGTIVRDNPDSILEVYQENWSWRSVKGSKAYMESVRGSLALLAKNVSIVPSHLGDGSIVAVVQPNIKDGLHEWEVWTSVRVGTMTLKLVIQGGKNIQVGKALPLMQKIMSNVSACCETCHQTTESRTDDAVSGR